MPTAEDIESQIVSMVGDLAEGVRGKELTPAHDLWETMNFRLIDFWSLIEERFDLTIPNEEIDKMHSIRDAVEFVCRERCG